MKNEKWVELETISPQAFNFLRSFRPDEIEDGRYDISEGIYVNIETYTTYFREERRFEAHKKYIDIQFMITGREIITKCSVDELECVEPYDNEKDIAFYNNSVKGIDSILEEGDFLICKQGEAHMPCICIDNKQLVRKAVIKIEAKGQ